MTALRSQLPFRDQRELVAAELDLVRARIALALTAREGEPHAWPAELFAAERLVAQRAAATRIELPVTWLRSRLELDDRELRVIWALIAHEMCPQSRARLRDLNTEVCTDPTTETVRLVAFAPGDDAAASRLLAPCSRLVRDGLIERTDTDAHAADHRRTWKVSRRLLALAHGDTSPDPELFRIAATTDLPRGIANAGIEADAACLPALTAALRCVGPRTVIVQGARGTGRRSLARAAAAACGREVIEVDTAQLATGPQARRQLAALARDCRLFGRVPLLRDLDQLLPVASAREEGSGSIALPAPDRIEMVAQELAGLLVIATTSRVIPGNRLPQPQVIELRPPTGAQLAALWQRALAVEPADAELFASMYPVAPAMIDAVAAVARARGPATSPEQLRAHVRTGLRATLDGRLAGLATRIEPGQTWESLVLPPDQLESIVELISRVRHRRTVYETWALGRSGRGLGLSALFSGPPGTGKTMTAGLIAAELAADLYQVDMTKIVSKWIGETEKNLAALFDAAEAGHAILLFDEADALFGKRTEVKSSNDRHANQETNYLLQRLEAFRGICILTTNHDTSIDEAFRRRISVHVDFPMPDAAERAALWRATLAKSVPADPHLALAALAERYEMSGGHIRNAVLRAAFFAADAGTPVTNAHLARAARLEYQAMGRIATSSL